MKKIIRIDLWVVLFLGLVPTMIYPQTAPQAAEQPSAVSSPVTDAGAAPVDDKIPGGIKGFVSLDLRDIEVIDALKFLSRKADLDIVTTKNVAGRVTLMVENVAVQDVFDIMLRSNRLAYDRRGEIYSVMTEDEYKALYGKSFSDTREVKTLRLSYIIPEQAFSLLDVLKSEVGRVLVDPESGSVLIMDIPERIKEMTRALTAFEERNEVRIFPLQYAKAKDIEEQLKNQLDGKRVGLIKADERQNQVIVQTLPDRMIDVERLIGELDTKTREVVIDATIVKIKITDAKTEGMEWEGLFNMLKLKGDLFYVGSTPFATVNPVSTAGNFTTRKETLAAEGYVGSYPFSGTTSSLSSSTPTVGTQAVHVGLVGSQDFDTIMRYVKNLGSSKILANPKLVITNNQESRIHVGEKQAYVTTTTTTGQVTSTVAEQVTFVDVGTQLAITPVINEDGYVTMKVKIEISSVSSTLITPTLNKIPIIDSSLAETTVMVKEGTTVIIGGLRKDEKTGTSKETPFLGKIPFLGHLFKTSTDTVDRFELIIMLTPKVITGDVFVSQRGQRVEHTGIKDKQEYNALRPLPQEVEQAGMKELRTKVKGADLSSVTSSALGDKKIILKGLRVLE
jgi:type II secretory pathway component GspD/PulD (secretin)